MRGKDIGDSDMEKQRHKVKNSEIRTREQIHGTDAQNREDKCGRNHIPTPQAD